MFVQSESSYLRKCSLGAYESIRNADPDGIWLLQGYPFNSLYDKFWGYNQVEAFVTAPPIDKLLILDNIAEVLPVYSQVNGYFGRSFVWCILQNYGGVNGMFGPINRINEGFFSARKNYPNMIGIGIGPEGINQNDLVFDYVMELVWYDDAPNVSYWFENYPLRRYGINDHRINQALQLLHQSVYNDPIGIKNHGRYSFISRPRPNSHSMLWYDPHLISLALRSLNDYLLIDPEIIDRTPTFTHDLIDITRQALQLVFDHHYRLLDRSFREKNLQSMIVSIKNLNDTLDLCESVLQSCENCLLHHWIQDARLLGANQFEQDFNEWQARTQLSIWGPNSNVSSMMMMMIFMNLLKLNFSHCRSPIMLQNNGVVCFVIFINLDGIYISKRFSIASELIEHIMRESFEQDYSTRSNYLLRKQKGKNCKQKQTVKCN